MTSGKWQVTRRRSYLSLLLPHVGRHLSLFSARDGQVKRMVAGAEVFAVVEHNARAAQDSHLQLAARVPQPDSRSKVPRGIVDLAGVEKRPHLQLEKTILVDFFVDVPIREDVIAPQPRRACPSLALSDLGPH